MPISYKTDDGYRLGVWVGSQRSTKDTMEPDRRQRLEALPGWSWAPFADKWEEGFAHLKQFSEQEGHCRIPKRHKTNDNYPLDIWVANRRKDKEIMEPTRRQRLEALPGWSWDVLSEQWEEGFAHLKQFSEREGHCRVAQDHRTDEGYRLSVWVAYQRKRMT
ncbi:MAG: helicase associated domain-containing protein [Xanthobacteraceae bacterium]